MGPHAESENGGEAGAGAEAVTRRYEFYKYTGEYAQEDHEAGCDDPLSGDPRCGPVDPDTNLAGVGDLIGAQNAAVNLFQPSVRVTKTGPAFSKATDTAIHNVTMENTSSSDSPNLVLVSFTDSLVAGVTPDPSCNNLAPGASCSFSYTYVVQQGDPDPLRVLESITVEDCVVFW